jgi:hypothetical protein
MVDDYVRYFRRVDVRVLFALPSHCHTAEAPKTLTGNVYHQRCCDPDLQDEAGIAFIKCGGASRGVQRLLDMRARRSSALHLRGEARVYRRCSSKYVEAGPSEREPKTEARSAVA